MTRPLLVILIAVFAAATPSHALVERYLIHDAPALNALWRSIGGEQWPANDRKGWPLPEGWQTGSAWNTNPSVFLVDSVSWPGDTLYRHLFTRGLSLYNSDSMIVGRLPNSLALPKLYSLSIRVGKRVTGSFPDLSGCPLLQTIYIAGRGLTGPIPALRFKDLTTLRIEETGFSGGVPSLNGCPKLQTIQLEWNAFDGPMADIDLPDLRNIVIKSAWNTPSRLTGPFPRINAPKLQRLDVPSQALSGQFPDLNRWPDLNYCDLQDNKLTGPLPSALNLPKITFLHFAKNPINDELPPITAPELIGLYITQCGLKGAFPVIVGQKLVGISADENKFSGAFPSLSLPKLQQLSLMRNLFDDIPHLKGTFPLMSNANVSKNRLHFDALERNADMGLNLATMPQDSVERFREVHGDTVTYSVNVRGSANTYTWYTAGSPIPGATQRTFKVHVTEDVQDYFCEIKNDRAPYSILFSRKSQPRPVANPLVIGTLSFYAESGSWEPDNESPSYSASGTITVNDVLTFEGTMSIDTESVALSAQGSFQLRNVPLPGGGMGTFTVAEGSYDLKLLGTDGRITDFANDALSKLPSFAGITVKLSEIKLLGGRTADGISISGTIEIDGLSGGCNDGTPGPTTLEVTDLEYTRSGGPALGGMKITDLGFRSFPRFCVKELQANYDRSANKLSFGATLSMPFAEVGGGMALIGDAVDSVAWRLEATQAAVPLGTTNMGMSGFFGSVSSIVEGPLDVTLGGVFVTMVPKDWVKFDLAGTYTAPSTIGASIDGVAIPTPGEDDQYQLKLSGSAKYNFADGIASLEGEAHLGTTDGEEYFLDGGLTVDLHAADLRMKGTLNGGYMIKAFGGENADEYPYDWMNAKLGLPTKVSTEANFIFGRSRLVFGVAHLGATMGDIEYVFDFNYRYDHPDFLTWKRMPAPQELRFGEPDDMPSTSTTVIIPDDATRMVVRLKGASGPLTSTLTLPNGTEVSTTDAARGIDRTDVTAAKKTFWTVLRPAAGRWTVNTPSRTASDVVEIFLDVAPAPFTFTATSTGRTVRPTWTPDGTAQDSVSFFIAGSGTPADGMVIGTAPLRAGTASFTLPPNVATCLFALEATGTRNGSVITDTSASFVSVSQGTMPTPLDITAKVFPTWKRVELTWRPNPETDRFTRSYLITARSGKEPERTLGEAFRWVGWAEVPYDPRPNDLFLVRSVGSDGSLSCPTVITGVSTDVDEDGLLPDGTTIVCAPNPASGRTTITVPQATATSTVVTVRDVRGTTVAICADPAPTARGLAFTLDTTPLPAGVYIISANVDGRSLSALLIVQ